MRNDGGSAFPAVEYMAERGMSLRDAFAIGALQGKLTRYQGTPQLFAREAYEIADAMLAEREKP